MIRRMYCFAGLEFAVEMPEEWMPETDGQLAPFRTERAAAPHVFRFEKAEHLDPPPEVCLTKQPDFLVYRGAEETVRYGGLVSSSWETAYFRAIHRGKVHWVQLRTDAYPGRVGSKTILDSFAAEHLIVENGGVFLHCSFIDCGGKAVLFTAPSRTGKSTQADLWNKYRGAQIINGDRAAVRIVGERILAEGIPFCGSSSYCENRSVPLAAIVYLAQAPKTSIRRMRGFEAFSRIWEGISVNTWDREDLERASETVKRIAESVPVYHMPCTPDEDAVSVLEQALRKQAQL